MAGTSIAVRGNKNGKSLYGKNLNKRNLPSKRSINLAEMGITRVNPFLAFAGIVIIILLAGLFSKFCVIDRLNKVSEAQAEVRTMESTLADAYKKIEEYGDVSDTYAHYTYSGMTQEELTRADRILAMNLLERIVLPEATVGSWKLSGNQMDVPIEGATLQQINQIVQKLQADDLVDFCTVTTAATSGVNVNEMTEDTIVLGQVTIYLNYNSEFLSQEAN